MINLDDSIIGNENFVKTLTERGIRKDGEQMSYAKAVDHGFERGAHFYGHNGYWGGFSAMMLKFPEKNLSLVAMANNTEISSPAMTYRMARYFLDEHPVTENRKFVKVPKKIKQKYCSDYITYKTGYMRKVIMSGDTLKYIVAPGVERVLKPVSKNLFKMAGVGIDYTFQFEESSNGSKSMLVRREGLIQNEYVSYEPIAKNFNIPSNLNGVYHSDELDVDYELEVSDNIIAVSVNGEEMMKYLPVVDGLYCSESTHHGYLVFSKNAQSGFTLNDYSLKSVNFKRKDS